MRVKMRGVALLAVAGVPVLAAGRATTSANSRLAVPLATAVATASCALATPQSPLAKASAAAARQAPEAQTAGDRQLANDIYSRLNADPYYYFRHVEVRADHGVAHLSGYVGSADAIYRAQRIARSVPGITGVEPSQLELERNGFRGGPAR